MKTLLKSLFVLALGAFACSGCEDVPEPYTIPGQGNGTGGSNNDGGLTYSSTSLSDWTVKTVKGTPWDQGSSYAKASGYDYDSKSTVETETWLVSPKVNTTTATGAVIDVDHVIRYVRNDNELANHKLYVSKDYTDDVTTATWTELDYQAVESTTNDWTFYAAAPIALPEAFLNSDVVFAFKFVCNSSNSTTWELKNFKVTEGTASGKPDDPGTETPNEYTYTPATSVAAGNYLICTDVDGKGMLAQGLGSKTYGWLSPTEVTVTDNTITRTSTDEMWTLKAVTGGYSIQDNLGHYLYMTGTYNSFNMSETMPAEGGVWNVTINSDGTASIVNTQMNKTVQYSTEFSSYGAYADVTHALPRLFVKSGEFVEPGNGNEGGNGGDVDDSKVYSVSEALDLYVSGSSQKVTVKGYIVGWVDGMTYASGVTFNANATSKTNLLIADKADETDASKCLPVQLPSGSVRTALNLQDNPDNYKKSVTISASLETYFRVAGLKSTTEYKFN